MNLGNLKIEGSRTYISLAVAAAYWVASSRGLFPRIPEVEAALLAMVVGFLRAGSKNDAEKAADDVIEELPAEAPAHKK